MYFMLPRYKSHRKLLFCRTFCTVRLVSVAMTLFYQQNESHDYSRPVFLWKSWFILSPFCPFKSAHFLLLCSRKFTLTKCFHQTTGGHIIQIIKILFYRLWSSNSILSPLQLCRIYTRHNNIFTQPQVVSVKSFGIRVPMELRQKCWRCKMVYSLYLLSGCLVPFLIHSGSSALYFCLSHWEILYTIAGLTTKFPAPKVFHDYPDFMYFYKSFT